MNAIGCARGGFRPALPLVALVVLPGNRAVVARAYRPREAFGDLVSADAPSAPPVVTAAAMASGAPAPKVSTVAGRIEAIVAALRTRGSKAGLELATRAGPAWTEATRRYISARRTTEEDLASEVADLTARVTRARAPADSPLALSLAFLEARLEEVRAARGRGQTPPQAVRDLPGVARHAVPTWVTYTGLACSLIAVLVTLGRSSG